MKLNIFSSGCALFAMLFGAGNIILPLILGRSLGDATALAMIGFILTAVLIPLIGFVAVMHARGDHRQFLGQLGKYPALIIAGLCMGLLGPFGAAPRCIAIAYADLAWYIPGLDMKFFSIILAFIIWFLSYKQNRVMTILGGYLGPLKITCLFALLAIGLLSPGPGELIHEPLKSDIFWQGLISGFGTMDLLAIIFFSKLVYENLAAKNIAGQYTKVCLVAGILLALVYSGFATMTAIHSARVTGIADDTMLSALTSILLGTKAGIFANISIGLTCLITAIALCSTFADFLSRDILKNKISYKSALGITVTLCALMANLRFSGIMNLVLPFLSLCYPALMFFAMLYIASELGWIKINKARIGFFIAFVITCIHAVFN